MSQMEWSGTEARDLGGTGSGLYPENCLPPQAQGGPPLGLGEKRPVFVGALGRSGFPVGCRFGSCSAGITEARLSVLPHRRARGHLAEWRETLIQRPSGIPVLQEKLR